MFRTKSDVSKDSLIVSVKASKIVDILTGFDTHDEGRSLETKSDPVLNITTVPFLSVITRRPTVSIKSCFITSYKGHCIHNLLSDRSFLAFGRLNALTHEHHGRFCQNSKHPFWPADSHA